MEKDTRPHCYRVEGRKVIPGVKDYVQQPGGYITREEKNDLYVIVEGSTERYISAQGVIFTSSSHMRPTEFFPSRAMAEDAACSLHHKKGCQDPRCGWSETNNNSSF